MPPSVTLLLPLFLSHWPWERHLNANYTQVKAESGAWFNAFDAFTPKAKLAFDKCDFGLLGSLGYSGLDSDDLRTAVDLLNVFFAFDAHTDGRDGPFVQTMVDNITDALRSPDTPRPPGEHIVVEIVRQFWQRASRKATPAAQARFLQAWTPYAQSVALQAFNRSKGHMMKLDEYIVDRRENSGVRPTFAAIDLALDLPDEVMSHPSIVSLIEDAGDLIALENDVYSYRVEVAHEEALYNILTILVAELDLDIQGAVDWVAKRHALIEARFLANMKLVPSWGPDVDSELAIYIAGLGQWVRGHECWSFESGRYFGREGLAIKKSRRVEVVYPQKDWYTWLLKTLRSYTS